MTRGRYLVAVVVTLGAGWFAYESLRGGGLCRSRGWR
jgi:hypothetical protein